jgi:hypothetical protein
VRDISALLKEAEANSTSPYAADFEYDGTNAINKTEIIQFGTRYHVPTALEAKSPPELPGWKLLRHHPHVQDA